MFLGNKTDLYADIIKYSSVISSPLDRSEIHYHNKFAQILLCMENGKNILEF